MVQIAFILNAGASFFQQIFNLFEGREGAGSEEKELRELTCRMQDFHLASPWWAVGGLRCLGMRVPCVAEETFWAGTLWGMEASWEEGPGGSSLPSPSSFKLSALFKSKHTILVGKRRKVNFFILFDLLIWAFLGGWGWGRILLPEGPYGLVFSITLG